MHSKKTMEINPFHPIIKELKQRSISEPDDKSLVDVANLLYDAALLQSGFTLKETAEFASRIHRVVASGLSIDPNAAADEEPEGDEAEPEAPPPADEPEAPQEDHDHDHVHEEL